MTTGKDIKNALRFALAVTHQGTFNLTLEGFANVTKQLEAISKFALSIDDDALLAAPETEETDND